MYQTEAQARRKARGLPMLGRFIAEVEVPETEAMRVERTTTSAGHHTVWGDPDGLLAAVRRVSPVDPDAPR